MPTPPKEIRSWWLAPLDLGDPLELLDDAGRWSVVAERTRRVELLDTFEWSLWHEGLVLAMDLDPEPSLELRDRDVPCWDDPLAAMPGRAGTFADSDWPPGPVSDRVVPLLGLRALRPVATLCLSCRELAVAGEDGRAPSRLRIEDWHDGEGPPVLRSVTVSEQASGLGAELARKGLERRDGSPLSVVLELLGVRPRRWSVRPDFAFTADTTSREAAAGMVLSLLGRARECVPGLLADVDTEFLHDYRICMRRSRAIVGQLKKVFPKSETARLRSDLGDLGRLTNRLRDLDVYLLDRGRLEELVPAEQRGALAGFFSDLVAEREEEFQRVRGAVAATHEGLLRAVMERLHAAAEWKPSKRGDIPVGDLARRLLRRARRRVLHDGRRLGPETPDADVHRLRIAGKKLRYLLEHFARLFDDKPVGRQLRRLKKLQEVLGDFNDGSVQRAFLLDSLASARGSGRSRTEVEAIRALADALGARQAAARARVEKAFASFDRTVIGEGAESIFGPA